MTNSRATYGYRRVWAMVNRTFRAGYNRKRIRRLIRLHGLMLPPRVYRRHGRPHLGQVQQPVSNQRCCSDVFLIPCWSGEVLSVAFASDCHDREVFAWTASPRPLTGADIARRQMLAMTGKLPRRVYACVGGGSNASGVFAGFLDDVSVELVGVEAGGKGIDTNEHTSRLAGRKGRPGVTQGYKSFFLQNEEGLIERYALGGGRPRLHRRRPGPGPPAPVRQGALRGGDRDFEVVEALRLTIQSQGLIPALESMRGCIVADLPPEKAAELNAMTRAQQLDPIFLMTPTNSPERLAEIGRQASGFVYCLARKGVTGKSRPLAGRGRFPRTMPHGDVAARARLRDQDARRRARAARSRRHRHRRHGVPRGIGAAPRASTASF